MVRFYPFARTRFSKPLLPVSSISFVRRELRLATTTCESRSPCTLSKPLYYTSTNYAYVCVLPTLDVQWPDSPAAKLLFGKAKGELFISSSPSPILLFLCKSVKCNDRTPMDYGGQTGHQTHTRPRVSRTGEETIMLWKSNEIVC